MSTPNPFGGENPFEGMPIFRDLAKLFMSGGPVNLELARQMAVWTATEGEAPASVDPLDRIRLEELIRVADLHVSEVTGLSTSTTGGLVRVGAVNRADWASRTLDAYRPLLERLATSLGATPVAGDDAGADDPADPSQLLGNLSQVLAPVMLGFTAGSMVGHLAQRAMGPYALPIPRPAGDELLLVPETITAFAGDWSLPIDDVRLWVCVHELAHHAVLGLPHVRLRLESLLGEYAGGFQADPNALEAQLGSFDPTDPAAFQAVLGSPEALLGSMQTDAQRVTLRHLEAVVAAIEGYVDHVLDTVGARLIASYGPLTEALRRRRVEASQSDRFVERLLGLEMTQALYDRGERFVAGVVERAGTDALSRLWHSAAELPTPAEIDAPGLWLARIDLPADSGD